MSSLSRRSSVSSSSAAGASEAPAKRPAVVEKAAKALSAAQQQAKKRVALGNLTNQSNLGRSPAWIPGTKGVNKAKAATSTVTVNKGPVKCVRDPVLHQKPLPLIPSIDVKPVTARKRDTLQSENNASTQAIEVGLQPCSTVVSPSHSGISVSLDETMSTCDSIRSPEFEYIDNGDTSTVASLERHAANNLQISEREDIEGRAWREDSPVSMETNESIISVDTDENDPQLCAALACDIYKHLRKAETKKRPSTDFMERVQKDISPSMRAILIDWLVEVAEEYRLVPDTLYLTVNYIDRYLSGNEMNRQRLQLLGIACMLIAAKYEEICAPQVEEFCYITDNTYFKDEVLQMEATVLNYLKFEMTAPTTKCFLRRFIRVSQECDEVRALQLEFLANYVAELSLLEYSLLEYPPSLIAAASIFLARFITRPTKQPWNATLAHYTAYRPPELSDCVKALHHLFCNSPNGSLPAIREKYSQHKYKFVAKKYCPPIPSEFFQDIRS